MYVTPSNFFRRILRSEALVDKSYFFLEQPFYGNYSTLDSHTITVISHAFAYSSRWRRKPWQGLFSRLLTMNFELCKFPCVHLILASDWFKNNQLLSQLTHAHYRDKVPLIVIQLFNYVYLPFNDMSICQAIMSAFHLIMFHYHSIISFSSFNIICLLFI